MYSSSCSYTILPVVVVVASPQPPKGHNADPDQTRDIDRRAKMSTNEVST